MTQLSFLSSSVKMPAEAARKSGGKFGGIIHYKTKVPKVVKGGKKKATRIWHKHHFKAMKQIHCDMGSMLMVNNVTNDVFERLSTEASMFYCCCIVVCLPACFQGAGGPSGTVFFFMFRKGTTIKKAGRGVRT